MTTLSISFFNRSKLVRFNQPLPLYLNRSNKSFPTFTSKYRLINFNSSALSFSRTCSVYVSVLLFFFNFKQKPQPVYVKTTEYSFHFSKSGKAVYLRTIEGIQLSIPYVRFPMIMMVMLGKHRFFHFSYQTSRKSFFLL